MPIETVEHTWIQDPDIASAVKAGEDYGGGKVVFTHDAQTLAVMQDILAELKKIEFHLMTMTDANLEQL